MIGLTKELDLAAGDLSLGKGVRTDALAQGEPNSIDPPLSANPAKHESKARDPQNADPESKNPANDPLVGASTPEAASVGAAVAGRGDTAEDAIEHQLHEDQYHHPLHHHPDHSLIGVQLDDDIPRTPGDESNATAYSIATEGQQFGKVHDVEPTEDEAERAGEKKDGVIPPDDCDDQAADADPDLEQRKHGVEKNDLVADENVARSVDGTGEARVGGESPKTVSANEQVDAPANGEPMRLRTRPRNPMKYQLSHRTKPRRIRSRTCRSRKHT